MWAKAVVLVVCVALGAGCSSGNTEPAAQADSGQSSADAAGGTDSSSSDLDAAQIVAALEDSGIPIGESVVWDETTDPNELLGRPGQYVGKATWTDTRVEPCYDGQPAFDCGGDVEVFKNENDRDERFDYLSLFATETGIGGYYMWKADNTVVRVGYELPPSSAATYEDALRKTFSEIQAFEP